MLNNSERERLVLDLYNQGRNVCEIAQEARMLLPFLFQHKSTDSYLHKTQQFFMLSCHAGENHNESHEDKEIVFPNFGGLL